MPKPVLSTSERTFPSIEVLASADLQHSLNCWSSIFCSPGQYPQVWEYLTFATTVRVAAQHKHYLLGMAFHRFEQNRTCGAAGEPRKPIVA